MPPRLWEEHVSFGQKQQPQPAEPSENWGRTPVCLPEERGVSQRKTGSSES